MLKYKFSVYHRLLIRVVLPVVLVLIILETFNYYIIKNSLDEASRRKSKIILNEVKTLQAFQDKALGFLEKNLNQKLEKNSKALVEKYFRDTLGIFKADLHSIRRELGMDPINEDIYVINSNGIVINTTFKKDFFLNFFAFGKEHEEYLLNIKDGNTFVSEKFAIEQNTGRLKKYTYQPTIDSSHIVELGMYSKDADKIVDFVADHLYKLTKIDQSINEIDLFIGGDRPFSILSRKKLTNEENKILHEVFEQKSKTYSVQDEKNSNITSEYMYVARTGSELYKGSVIKIVYDSTADKARLRIELAKSMIFGIIISFIVFWILMERMRFDITRPLEKLVYSLEQTSIGNISTANKANIAIKNEFGKLGNYVDNLIDMMKNAINFARQIGKGNLTVEYDLVGNADALGRALMDMQANLIHLDEEKKRRDKEDEKQKWLTNGINKFSQILRESSDNLKELSSNIISNLVRYIGAVQGGIFIYNDTDPENTKLELIATYAFNQERHIEKTVKPGEGLIGMCFLEKYTIYRTEIPNDYVNITSGLGEANPSSILVVPLKLHHEIFGVIELASFNEFEPSDTDFVEKIAESISYTLSTVKTNTQTNALLTKSRKQSEEFALREKELLNKIEELNQQLKNAQNTETDLNNQLQMRNRDLELANEKIIKFRQIQVLQKGTEKVIPDEMDKKQF